MAYLFQPQRSWLANFIIGKPTFEAPCEIYRKIYLARTESRKFGQCISPKLTAQVSSTPDCIFISLIIKLLNKFHTTSKTTIAQSPGTSLAPEVVKQKPMGWPCSTSRSVLLKSFPRDQLQLHVFVDHRWSSFVEDNVGSIRPRICSGPRQNPLNRIERWLLQLWFNLTLYTEGKVSCSAWWNYRVGGRFHRDLSENQACSRGIPFEDEIPSDCYWGRLSYLLDILVSPSSQPNQPYSK